MKYHEIWLFCCGMSFFNFSGLSLRKTAGAMALLGF